MRPDVENGEHEQEYDGSSEPGRDFGTDESGLALVEEPPCPYHRPTKGERGNTRAEAERLLTTQELADFLRVPLPTLYKWSYEGTGPVPLRIGKYLRYRWSDVEAWLELQKRW
jgi:excisionase family DNA binding protein